MKTVKLILLVFISLVYSREISAQKKGHVANHHQNHPHRHHPKIVKRSPYHPNKIVVYHPHWHKDFSYNRRWVYFPKYNLYWDNWRNHYVFLNGNIWVSQPQAPAFIINLKLNQEKNIELKEDMDDVDDIYKDNTKHQEENKPE